jgi:hypothetical protein
MPSLDTFDFVSALVKDGGAIGGHIRKMGFTIADCNGTGPRLDMVASISDDCDPVRTRQQALPD